MWSTHSTHMWLQASGVIGGRCSSQSVAVSGYVADVSGITEGKKHAFESVYPVTANNVPCRSVCKVSERHESRATQKGGSWKEPDPGAPL